MKNIEKAVEILKGKTIVASDRRAATATPIPFKKITLNGRPALRPEFGVSYDMQNELTALASSVEFVRTKARSTKTMPVYVF